MTGTTNEVGDLGRAAATRSFTVDSTKAYTFSLSDPTMSMVVYNSKNQVVARASNPSEATNLSTTLLPGEYTAVMTKNSTDSFGADYSLDISERETVPDVSSTSLTKITGQTKSLVNGKPAATRTFTVDNAKDFNFSLVSPQMTMTIYNEKNEVVTQAASGSDSTSVAAKLGPGTYHAVLTQKYADTAGKDYQLDISERTTAVVTSTGGVLKGTAYTAASSNDSCVQRNSLKVIQGGNYSIDLSMPNSTWTIQDKDGKVVAAGDTRESAQVTDFLKKKSYSLATGDYTVVLVLPTTLTQSQPWNFNLVGRVDGIDQAVSSSSDSGALPGSAAIQKTLAERTARLKQWAAESSSSSSSSGTTA